MTTQKSMGFTLIEISIVLVIIGLLAGGILKGQQMIENSKYKAWVKQIDGIRAAVMTFKDRYKYYPGDFPYASTKFPVISGVSFSTGNGDGLVSYNWSCSMVQNGPCEMVSAIQHLVHVGLIPGNPQMSKSEIYSPVGGQLTGMRHIGLGTTAANSKIRLMMEYMYIPPQMARRLDEEFDDGKPMTGDIYCWYCNSTNWDTVTVDYIGLAIAI